MNQLQRRSDGACETKDGLFAVKIRVVSGQTDDTSWFEFKPAIMGPIIRIEWPADAPFALLPQEEARTLVRAGYAIGITDQEMDEYNKAVGTGNGQAAPEVKPEVQRPPVIETTPSWVNPTAPEQSQPAPLPQVQPTTPIGQPVASQPLRPIEPASNPEK